MPNVILDSVVMQDCLDRWRAGDRAAADELLRLVISRLEQLARKMLRAFPNIRCHVDTDDVLQNSLLRFLHTLQRIKPTTTRHFFNLAAVHIRRELLDIARSKSGKGTVPLDIVWSDGASPREPSDDDGADADRWMMFHEAVDQLPIEEREVVGLVFYHAWTQQRIAELFQVDTRTIRRRWTSACARLKTIVGSDFFEK